MCYNAAHEKAQYQKDPEAYNAMLATLEHTETEWLRRYDRNHFGDYNNLRTMALRKTACTMTVKPAEV